MEVSEGMSIWARVQNLPGVREIYGPHFPLEIRHFFCSWLESQPWNTINENDERQKDVAQQYTDTLLKLMRGKIEELQNGPDDMFLLRLRLEEITQGFEKYAKDPLGLVKVIKNCMKREKAILENGPVSLSPSSAPQVDEKTISDLTNMHKQIDSADSQLKNLQQQQEFFVIQYQELCKLQTPTSPKPDQNLSPEQKKKTEALKAKKLQLERLLSEEGSKILQTRQILGNFYQDCLNAIAAIQDNFVNEKLEKWKSLQCLGMISDEEQTVQLDAMQLICERLAENQWMIRQQLRQLNALQEQLFLKPDEPDTTLPLNTRLMNQCNILLRTLVQSSFVLEKQPPQVLKTQTKFSATARLLIGGKLNIYMSPPEVKASIISQQQARSLLSWQNDLLANAPPSQQMLESLSNLTGTLLNDRKVFEFYKESSSLKCTFKNLSLKKIKRRDTKTDEVVTEEKFGLVLHCFFSVGDMTFCVHTQSNPTVVIVHGNQFANAVATVLWDNFFREKNREPYLVPDAVPWSLAAVALNNHFSIVNTVPLRDSDLEFLKHKVIGSDDGLLTWSCFNRETLPQRSFTFWEWFYGIEEVVRKHAHGPWCDGLITGFISKKDAENLLLQRPIGTFLLRFSDSELGGISVAWVGEDRQPPQGQDESNVENRQPGERSPKKVWHLQPWFAKDLVIRSLADRLSDLPQLTTLYPTQPKDEVFMKYYTLRGIPSSSQDYVRTSIAATVLMENLNLNKRKADMGIKDELHEYHDWNMDESGNGGENGDFMSSMNDDGGGRGHKQASKNDVAKRRKEEN